MKRLVAKAVLEKGKTSVSELIKAGGASSYSVYRAVEELQFFGIVLFRKGKVGVLPGPALNAFSRLFFEGFDVEILSEKNVKFLARLPEGKSAVEISKETGLSPAQVGRILTGLAQFLEKRDGKYFVSAKNTLLLDFLKAVREKEGAGAFWAAGGEKLLKLPKGMPFNGVLTAFSRFSGFGVQVFPSHAFVFQPARDLKIEEILAHAIRFSGNANDLMLCILFYLKNMHRINILELEKNVGKFEASDTWLDIVAFLEDREVKMPELFLPKKEFGEKAAEYGLKIPSRFGKSAVEKAMDGIERNLEGKAIVFVIGGNALMEYNLKNSTKDIDLVASSQVDMEKTAKALEKNGFMEAKKKHFQYERLNSRVFEKEGMPKIDLFAGKICNVFEFSEGMRKRSKKARGGMLEIWIASLEDIFLLKTVSSRDADIVDCEAILESAKLDWKAIGNEFVRQKEKLNGLEELTILDHLEILEKKMKITIPFKKKVLSAAIEKGILFLAEKPVTVSQILEKIDFSEQLVRNMIVKLEKEGKIEKIAGKPFKIRVRSGKTKAD